MNDNYKNEPLIMALGFFDGVHKGHQSLINKAIDIAKGATRF